MGNHVSREDFEWSNQEEPHAKRRVEILSKQSQSFKVFCETIFDIFFFRKISSNQRAVWSRSYFQMEGHSINFDTIFHAFCDTETVMDVNNYCSILLWRSYKSCSHAW